jgi:hypothetical protein
MHILTGKMADALPSDSGEQTTEFDHIKTRMRLRLIGMGCTKERPRASRTEINVLLEEPEVFVAWRGFVFQFCKLGVAMENLTGLSSRGKDPNGSILS